MPTRVAALAVALTFAFAACGGDDDDESSSGRQYPDGVRTNFLKSCEAQEGANRAGCVCALEGIEEKYSFGEFRDIEETVRDGREPPPDFVEIAEDCARDNR